MYAPFGKRLEILFWDRLAIPALTRSRLLQRIVQRTYRDFAGDTLSSIFLCIFVASGIGFLSGFVAFAVRSLLR